MMLQNSRKAKLETERKVNGKRKRMLVMNEAGKTEEKVNEADLMELVKVRKNEGQSLCQVTEMM